MSSEDLSRTGMRRFNASLLEAGGISRQDDGEIVEDCPVSSLFVSANRIEVRG